MNRKILERIDFLFSEALKEKTGWGKNEVLIAYRKAVTQALAEYVDQMSATK